jgi:hypothetical protein
VDCVRNSLQVRLEGLDVGHKHVGACGDLSAYVSIRQHTSAYVSIRHRRRAQGCWCLRGSGVSTSAYASRQHTTSAYASRQHTTSAYA